MSQPLISVIVPIYNVEKYVRKCLDSLKNQTMKEIEIICIDDGSTDESGKIAEEYKDEEGWPRFRIIHTENKGLSAARNRGIDEARANWIMFVDSDDWVDHEFCRIPYKEAILKGADLVFYRIGEKTKWKFKNLAKISTEEVDEYKAHIIGECAVWNKLYQRTLFQSIRFPEGRVHEDTAIMHKLVHSAKKIVYIDMALYHYNYRTSSISHSHNSRNARDYFVFAKERCDSLALYGYPDAQKDVLLFRATIGFLARSTPSDDALFSNAIKVMNTIKGIPRALSFKQRCALIVWKINRKLFYFLCHITGRMNK